MTSDEIGSPFDGPHGSYLGLVNAAGHRSLWPAGLTVPDGWSVEHEAGARDAVLASIERDWTGTASPLPAGGSDQTLPELFRQRVRATPDVDAVRADGYCLSYAELARRSASWAAHLADLGVGPGRVVAVLAQRGLEFVVAALAVVRAGGAYLPIDVDLPAARVGFILDDARPHCVLATADAATRFAEQVDGFPTVRLDEHVDGPPPTAGQPTAPGPADPAYVMYTSGSTGDPKGVVISHRAIVNQIAWSQHRYGLTTADRVLLKTPIGFDVAAWELLWPLTAGAALVVADGSVHRDPGALAALIRRERVTAVHFVPSMLTLFIDQLARQPCPSLRTVFSGGEALSPQLCQRFFEVSDAALHNVYGPTEVTVHTTAWEVPRGWPGPAVPIGDAVTGTGVYVLDEHLDPTPPGVVGELYATGVQLADGYLNRPALTAERFVACPFEPGGARMYRTGDRVRSSPDGILEYVGRADAQVKVNGARIELGEVESVLGRHPAVDQAAVVVADTRAGEAYLSAFVTPAGEAGDPSALAASVRAMAAQMLPAYAVPSRITVVPRMPTTVNGKLDRRALVALSGEAAAAAPALREPRDEYERVVAELMAAALGLPAVGIDDDFFSLGGTSLGAIRLTEAVSRVFDISFKLRMLLTSPVVADIAKAVAQLQGATAVRQATR